MVANSPPEYLTDLIMNVNLQNGVFRITFGQLDSNNRAVPVTRLLVPANQLAKMISGLDGATKKIATQLRERAQEAQDKAEGSGKAADDKKAAAQPKDKKKK